MRPNTFKSLTKFLGTTLLAGLALDASLHAQIRYELVVPEVLGNPINQISTRGNEISEKGETLLNRVTTFAVWKEGAVTHIANSASDYHASLSKVSAASLNSFQQVVGSKTYRIKTESATHNDVFPFYWDPANGLLDLDELGARSDSGAGNTQLFGINENGVSLGTSDAYQGEDRSGNTAFTWSFETGRIDIPALSLLESSSYTTPNAINDSDTVVGTFRAFNGNLNSYSEQGFVYSRELGSVKLRTLDPEFFEATHITARDINNSSAVVGERDSEAYLFDLETQSGIPIPAPSGSYRSVRAYAINDLGYVVGGAESSSLASPQSQLSPFLWSAETGSIDLLPHIVSDLLELLPEGQTVGNTRITAKSINNAGHISASLETSSGFAREILLQPALNLIWDSMVQTTENGVNGVLYTHFKGDEADYIPASSFGYEIGFECSSDMKSWTPIDAEDDGVRIQETDTHIELFVPFSDCIFIRPCLLTASN